MIMGHKNHINNLVPHYCCDEMIPTGVRKLLRKFLQILDAVVLNGIILLLTWLVDVLINQDVLGDDDCQSNDD